MPLISKESLTPRLVHTYLLRYVGRQDVPRCHDPEHSELIEGVRYQARQVQGRI